MLTPFVLDEADQINIACSSVASWHSSLRWITSLMFGEHVLTNHSIGALKLPGAGVRQGTHPEGGAGDRGQVGKLYWSRRCLAA
jgi:hypothetical protein